MNDCPKCEYNKNRAARWRAEAYKQGGHDVIEAYDWDIERCRAYAEQLRDKTRANTAEHAAQAIEWLLAQLAQGEEHMTPWSQKTIEQKIEASISHYKKEIERAKEAGNPLQITGILEAFVMCLENILEKNS